MEKLYQDIQFQESKYNIKLENDDRLRAEFKLFGLQNRIDHNRDLLSKEQPSSLREFRKKREITIRKEIEYQHLV